MNKGRANIDPTQSHHASSTTPLRWERGHGRKGWCLVRLFPWEAAEWKKAGQVCLEHEERKKRRGEREWVREGSRRCLYRQTGKHRPQVRMRKYKVCVHQRTHSSHHKLQAARKSPPLKSSNQWTICSNTRQIVITPRYGCTQLGGNHGARRLVTSGSVSCPSYSISGVEILMYQVAPFSVQT